MAYNDSRNDFEAQKSTAVRPRTGMFWSIYSVDFPYKSQNRPAEPAKPLDFIGSLGSNPVFAVRGREVRRALCWFG